MVISRLVSYTLFVCDFCDSAYLAMMSLCAGKIKEYAVELNLTAALGKGRNRASA